MSFEEALNQLKKGKKIQRKGWNGKTQYVQLAYMVECICSDGNRIYDIHHNEIGSAFLMFVGTSGYQCGWLASQADMLALDWQVVEEH